MSYRFITILEFKSGDINMADNHTHDTKTAMDYNEHDKTYALFLVMVKYGSIAVTLILILMALFLLPQNT
jgi:Bacterial aa3 type cytochrome c oxidase subunit IV